jgi:hypothetical protein
MGFLEHATDAIKDVLAGRASVLFVPFAGSDPDAYTTAMRTALARIGVRVTGLHEVPDAVRAIGQAEAIFVGGGNSFRLLRHLNRLGALAALREAAVTGGVPYLGASAGSNLACPTIRTTNDMPIVRILACGIGAPRRAVRGQHRAPVPPRCPARGGTGRYRPVVPAAGHAPFRCQHLTGIRQRRAEPGLSSSARRYVQRYVAPMAVFALWSAPRARSTAFLRSIIERGDMTVLHEPFCNLRDYGETAAGARTFDSSRSLLAWLRDEAHDMNVFLKDHPPTACVREVLADRRFLAGARHAFLIRRPEEIAASSYALEPSMKITAIGLERLCEVQDAVRDAGGDASVVIDSDDLVTRPEATMAAYCAAVGLPFIARALTWEPGERSEWCRSARWHVDVSASSSFEPRERVYPHTVENSRDLARIAAHHRPFYERLYAQRLDVTPWDHTGSSY